MTAASKAARRPRVALANVAEACWFLRISRATLDRWEREGRVKRVKGLGRMVRFRWADLHQLTEGE